MSNETVIYAPQCHNGCPHHNALGCWVGQDCNMKPHEIKRERARYGCLKPGDYASLDKAIEEAE
jgi:hypothetical protein